MRRTFAVLLATIALAACGGDDPAAGGSSTVATTTAPTATTPTTAVPVTTATVAPATTAPATTTVVTTAPPTTAPAPAGSDLPACDTVQPEFTTTGTAHPDCSLVTSGDPAQVLEVRFGEADPTTGDSAMTIIALDGTQPPIEEAVGGTFVSPSLTDLDADGTEELLVPLFTGAQNTAYAVWARPAAGEAFIRAGEVGGLDFGLTADGYVVALGHSSASASYADISLLRDGRLVPIASLELDVVDGTCTLTDAGGLAEVGLDEATAVERFCSDPAIAR